MALTKPKAAQVNFDITNISDPLITLNKIETPPANNATDVGIIAVRGSAENNVAMVWDESSNEFAIIETTSDGLTSGDVNVTAYANLHAANITTANGSALANIVEDITPQLGGDLDVNSKSFVSISNGDITFTPDGTGVVHYNSKFTIGTGPAITFSNLGIIATEPDIMFAQSGLVAAEDHIFIAVDGTNDSTGTLKVIYGGTTSSAAVAFEVGESIFQYKGVDVLTDITGESIKDLSDVFSTMTPSDGQALIYDDTNGWQSETISTGTLSNIVEDLTPQLGGDLDTNGNDIITADVIDANESDGINITQGSCGATATGTSHIQIRAADNTGTTAPGANIELYAGTAGSGGPGGSIELYVAGGVGTGSIEFHHTVTALSASTGYYEASTNGTNAIFLKAPLNTTASRTWILPQDNPATAAGNFLTTDASGVTSFTGTVDGGSY